STSTSNSRVEAATSKNSRQSSSPRKHIPVATKRAVYQRDKCCQWRNPRTGRVCGSKFQLQIDHIRPIWAEGENNPENLQLLCATHNRMKYKIEAGMKPWG